MGKSSATHLDDILLILSLFTMRHVWADSQQGNVVIADHRFYQYGWSLRQGLPFVEGTNRGGRIDVGFEPGINSVLETIGDKEWRARYRGGHYLFLANHTFRRQILETAFSLCWTIWEHLFSLHNDNWLDKRTIHRISGGEKIAFVLQCYGLRVDIGATDSPLIKQLEETRNRLLHFGKFPAEDSMNKATEFIRWTEYLIAKTLGLYGEESFESVDSFDKAATAQSKPRTRSEK